MAATGVTLVAVLCLAGKAAAQADDSRRIERQLRIADSALTRYRPDPSLSLEERSLLDAGGYLSFQAIFLQDGQNNGRTLLQPEMAVFARGSIDGAHSAFVRARVAYRDFSSGDSFDGRGDRLLEPVLDRYWYEFDLKNLREAGGDDPGSGNFNVRVGRQFIDWGSGLALSETLYAAKAVLTFDKSLRLEGLAGITPDHTIDFDTSRVDFDEKTRRTYFGGRLVYTDDSANEFYAFYLYSGDKYGTSVSRAPVVFTDAQFDNTSHYLGLGANVTLDANWALGIEGIAQLGTTFSDPIRGPQERTRVEAGAARLNLSYLFRDANRSRIELESLFGTGDDDRFSPTDTVGGNAPGTVDRSFNSLGFANTGLAFGAGVGNLWSTRLGFSFEPFPDMGPTSGLQCGVDAFLLNKVSTRAPIDEPSTSRRFLGGELDFFINYRFSSDLALQARYGVFLPSAGIDGLHSARHFTLLGIVFSF